MMLRVTTSTRQPDGLRSSVVPPLDFHRGWAMAADLLFPPVCSLCAIPLSDTVPREPRVFLCERCILAVTEATGPSCPGCARPLPLGANLTAAECPYCRVKRFRFTRALALGVYAGTLREAVLQIKQATGESLALALGHLVAERLERELPELPTHLVSVPTHWTRRLTRVTNCPEVLLEVIARRFAVRSSPRLLYCRRKTNKQGTLLPVERLSNVRGAYAVSAGYDITGAHVLVVDDVMTTGATANEIAKILLRRGAKSVSIAVVARGIGFDD